MVRGNYKEEEKRLRGCWELLVERRRLVLKRALRAGLKGVLGGGIVTMMIFWIWGWKGLNLRMRRRHVDSADSSTDQVSLQMREELVGGCIDEKGVWMDYDTLG